jgi:hypothetical protein
MPTDVPAAIHKKEERQKEKRKKRKIPAAMAMTFFTAPPISTPTTSREVKTRKVWLPNSSATFTYKAHI